MRPQGMVVTSVGGVEIDGVANDDGQVFTRVAVTCTVVYVSDLPCGMVGGVVGPQFSAVASIFG